MSKTNEQSTASQSSEKRRRRPRPAADPDEQLVVCRLCGRAFRAVNNFHLRRAHGYEGDHPVHDYEREFGLPVAQCGNSRANKSVEVTEFWKRTPEDELDMIRAKMSDAHLERWDEMSDEERAEISQKMSRQKTRYWKKLGKHWTRGRVLAEMRQRLQNGLSLQKSRVPGELYAAAVRRFGSWQAAVSALGLNYDDITAARRWTRASVIAEIQKLHAEEVDLSPGQIKRRYSRLYGAATAMFPRSWAKALRAAGINPSRHMTPRTRWNRELATAWVQNRNAKGRSILVRDAPAGMQAFLRRELGVVYSDFVESLGIPYPGVKQCHDWSSEKVLAEIRRWQADGHPTNIATLNREYQALVRQARKYFQSWDRACAAAGVAVDRPPRGASQKWSRELVVAEIQSWKARGLPTNSAAVARGSQTLYKQARKVFWIVGHRVRGGRR